MGQTPTMSMYSLLEYQDVTLHDLDAANARPQGGQDIFVPNGSDDEAPKNGNY